MKCAPLPLWAALLVAAAAGPVLDAGFPDKGFWPLTFVGIGLVLVTLIGRRAGSAYLVAFVASLSFYVVHIQWATLFLGLLPMMALAVLQSLIFAAGSVLITLAYRWLPGAFPGRAGGLLLTPVIVAGLWTAHEAVASVWPYGGFAWGRMSQSQSQSPFADLFSWLGVSGVSFVMVLLVAMTIEALRRADAPRLTRSIAPVALATLMLVVPLWPVPSDGEMRIAAVQGNGDAGYFAGSTSEQLLQAQVDATAPLFGEDVDLVVWPEGSTFRDPLTDEYTAAVFDYIAQEMGAPLLAQGITQRDDKIFNSLVLVEEGAGVTDVFDKRHPVPFGEYIPDRAFWRPFAPDLIDLVARDYTPGTTDAVFDVGGVWVGVNICFDIVDDALIRESVLDGASVIVASSNTADFGRTDESAQQLAIARIRAIETGRTVVNLSTVGISAMIAPDGNTIAQLPWFEAGAMVETVSLASGITPAVRLGAQLELLVAGLGLGGLVVAGVFGRRHRG